MDEKYKYEDCQDYYDWCEPNIWHEHKDNKYNYENTIPIPVPDIVHTKSNQNEQVCGKGKVNRPSNSNRRFLLPRFRPSRP